MLRTVLHYESRLLRADQTVWLVLGLFIVIVGYAVMMGHQHATEQQAEKETSVAAYDSRIAENQQQAATIEAEKRAAGESLETFDWGVRHPYSMGSSRGKIVAMPSAPLGAFAVGQTDLLSSVYKITSSGYAAHGQGTALENPFKLLVGHFDLLFVILFLFPLFILALTYNLTASERETGLLRMLLAQPIGLPTLVWGKVLIRAALLFGAAIACSAVAYLLTHAGESGSGTRFLFWLLIVVLYGGFWMGLAVFVGSLGIRATTNAMILAVCWLGFVVVVPAIINVVASSIYPVPSRMAYVTAMREETSVAEQQSSESLARFFHDHPEIAPVSDEDANFAMLRVARQERINEQLAPIVASFETQRAHQQRFIRALSYLSPALLVQQGLLDVAGTGHHRHAHFTETVQMFQEIWKDYFTPLYFANVAWQSTDYDTLPRFSFTDESWAMVLGRLALPIGVLLAVTALLFTAGFGRYRKQTLTA